MGQLLEFSEKGILSLIREAAEAGGVIVAADKMGKRHIEGLCHYLIWSGELECEYPPLVRTLAEVKEENFPPRMPFFVAEVEQLLYRLLSLHGNIPPEDIKAWSVHSELFLHSPQNGAGSEKLLTAQQAEKLTIEATPETQNNWVKATLERIRSAAKRGDYTLHLDWPLPYGVTEFTFHELGYFCVFNLQTGEYDISWENAAEPWDE